MRLMRLQYIHIQCQSEKSQLNRSPHQDFSKLFSI